MKYLRSLSFIQGTCVNFLRTSILFLMLYLIYTRRHHRRPVLLAWIYSFFIFGPLQELGNIINIYRETEASLNVFQAILAMPKEPKPVESAVLGDDLRHARIRRGDVPAPIGDVAGRLGHFVRA